MKKVKHLVVMVLLAFTFFQWTNAIASTAISCNVAQSLGEITLKRNPAKRTDRPNAPVRDYVSCIYGMNFIEILFPDGVSSMSIYIYNEDDEFTGTVNVDTPWIEIPEFSGIYDIECISDDGREYIGVIEW